MSEWLVDGGLIRKVWLAETDRYRDHLLRLDDEGRRNRFGGAVADDIIARYAETAFGLDAVVHGFFVDGVMRGAAELRAIDRHVAEAAFSVETPWQSPAVGSALLERTILTARNRAIRQLHMYCLADNKRMQQLATKFEAELSFDFGDVVGEVQAARPTPLSLLREFIADGHAVASAMLDAQARMLKAS